jgi:hypothetical protein
MTCQFDIEDPEFLEVYLEILKENKMDGTNTNFIVPANGSGLILPASQKLTEEYFGDGEYERRLAEIEIEDQFICLDLPEFEDL